MRVSLLQLAIVLKQETSTSREESNGVNIMTKLFMHCQICFYDRSPIAAEYNGPLKAVDCSIYSDRYDMVLE